MADNNLNGSQNPVQVQVPENEKNRKNMKQCKSCGQWIAKSAKTCPNCGAKNKKPIFKKPWFWILIAAVIVAAVALSSGDKKAVDVPEKDRKYISESEVSSALKNATDYEGKFIKVYGEVFNTDTGSENEVQLWADKDHNTSYVVKYDKASELKENEYVLVDGMISGDETYTNIVGGKMSVTVIDALSVKKVSYFEAFAPALKTKKINKDYTQAGVTLTVKKVEYAADETRVYVSVKNNSKYDADVYTAQAVAIQGGKQYEQTDNTYGDEYPEVSELKSGASADGIMVFPKLSQDKQVKVTVSAYTDNWEADMDNFSFSF